MMRNIKDTNKPQKISLLGNPQSTNNIYKRHGNIIYLSKAGKDLKESYMWQIKSQYKDKPLLGSVKICIELFFSDKRKRDWDNYHKLSMDSLQGIILNDDCQIIEAHVFKNYDKSNPRIELLITPLN